MNFSLTVDKEKAILTPTCSNTFMCIKLKLNNSNVMSLVLPIYYYFLMKVANIVSNRCKKSFLTVPFIGSLKP